MGASKGLFAGIPGGQGVHPGGAAGLPRVVQEAGGRYEAVQEVERYDRAPLGVAGNGGGAVHARQAGGPAGNHHSGSLMHSFVSWTHLLVHCPRGNSDFWLALSQKAGCTAGTGCTCRPDSLKFAILEGDAYGKPEGM